MQECINTYKLINIINNKNGPKGKNNAIILIDAGKS